VQHLSAPNLQESQTGQESTCSIPTIVHGQDIINNGIESISSKKDNMEGAQNTLSLQ
jgi:hypothetical protein